MAEVGSSALVVEATGSATADLPSSALLVGAAEGASAMPHSYVSAAEVALAALCSSAPAVKEAAVSAEAAFCSSVFLVDVVVVALALVHAHAGLVLAPEAVCRSVPLVCQLLALFLHASLVH